MNYEELTFDEDDQLGRKEFVISLMNVINNWDTIKKENDSLAVSVDAPWGSGKSYLLNMWRNWLLSKDNADKKYAITCYNAWKNDDNENAFIPLAYSLQKIEVFKENTVLYEITKEKTKGFIKACSIALLKDIIKKHIGENISDIISEGVDGANNTKVESFFDNYEKYQSKKHEFKIALRDLIPDGGKLIIFIDELDRCRPTFAIETLEIIKHLFDIPNIIFVFAIDLEQISHSISTIYGNGMDSSGYLRRFFDLNINIPTINKTDYVNILMRKFVNEKHINAGLIRTVANLYDKLNLSLRDMNKITDNFLVFCLFYDKYFIPYNRRNTRIVDIFECYLFFIILKYKNPQIYNLIIHNNYIAYDNNPRHYEVLDINFFVSENISNMLRDLQNGGAHLKNDKFIVKYGCRKINSKNLSFAEHIEKTIEMFIFKKNENDNINLIEFDEQETD